MEKYSSNWLQYQLYSKTTRVQDPIFNQLAKCFSNAMANFQIAISIHTVHQPQLTKISKTLSKCLKICMNKCSAVKKHLSSHQWECTIFAYLNRWERPMKSFMKKLSCTEMKMIQQPLLNSRLMYFSHLTRHQYSVHAVSFCLQKKWIEACCDHFDEVLELIEDI